MSFTRTPEHIQVSCSDLDDASLFWLRGAVGPNGIACASCRGLAVLAQPSPPSFPLLPREAEDELPAELQRMERVVV